MKDNVQCCKTGTLHGQTSHADVSSTTTHALADANGCQVCWQSRDLQEAYSLDNDVTAQEQILNGMRVHSYCKRL